MCAEQQQPPKPLRNFPEHIAIIMDGNGRWAKQRGLTREKGHKEGVENVKRIVECAKEMNLRYLTLYAFSVENWNRPKREVNALMRLLESFLKSQSEDLVKKKIRFRVIGRIDEMPPRVAKLLNKSIEETREFDQWNLTLALNYGSRTEIVDAVRAYSMETGTDPQNLDWETFSKYLYTGSIPDPDLVIRTSGEYRISNFLLMQSAYAEYFFSDQFWPDFGAESMRAAVESYRHRERRFGMTGEQIKKKEIL